MNENAEIWAWNPMSSITQYHSQYTWGPNGTWFCLHGKDGVQPFLDGTQSARNTLSVYWELSRENPRAVLYSYHKGELWGFISSLTLSPRCSSLRYHENIEIHGKISKVVMTDSVNTGCEHACHTRHCQPWRSHTGRGRPATGLLPAKLGIFRERQKMQ